MDRLNDYALQAGRAASPGLLALNRHFSKGTHREAKDVESIWKVRVRGKLAGAAPVRSCPGPLLSLQCPGPRGDP